MDRFGSGAQRRSTVSVLSGGFIIGRTSFAVNMAAHFLAIILAIILAAILSNEAFGVFGDDLTPSETSGQTLKTQTTAKSGIFSALEFNPADLLNERLRITGEYLIVDGFAFGGVFEGQKRGTSLWRHTTLTAGVTASQYFLSQTLNGPFVRGEVGGMGSVFRLNQSESLDKAVYGANFGLDLGYRMNFGSRFTSHAAYGVRRAVPDFFGTQGVNAVKEYESRTKNWTMRVLLAMGVSL
jgi:hypothetical protein